MTKAGRAAGPRRGTRGTRPRAGDFRAFLGRYSDVALAALVIATVGMMIVPLPTFVLDLLLSLNVAGAVTLLLVSIYVAEAVNIAVFPTLLLLTTLFRLALEVSATRLILLNADAGEVIQAFGNFVVAGNLVVGAVVFFILTVIQFIVIAKGAERVAEVGARFTLDAMPGKQMSIDAELRAGHIDRDEARRRRAAMAREAQFFGAMDGAMKFVKGDAIAGVVILLTNVVGGLVIGVAQRGMDVGTAARTFTVLTIGEGLVAQIPALIISTAAGIIVTRVSSEEEGAHLGREVLGQITRQPKALAIAAATMGLLALVPGLPTLPFLALAAALGFVAHRLMRQAPPSGRGDEAASGEERRDGPGGAHRTGSDDPAPVLAPILVELGAEPHPGDGGGDGTAAIADRFVSALLPALRERAYQETGIPLPAVRVRRDAPGAPAGGYVIKLSEVPMGRGELLPGGGLAAQPAAELAALGIDARPGTHPDGGPAAWIGPAHLAAARLRGIATLAPEEVVAAHLLALFRRFGHELVGIEEAQALVDALGKSHPTLVREVVPKLVSPVLLADVLRRLAEEGISLRALREILGALAEWAPIERDPAALTEHVRAALRRQITSRHAGPAGDLAVYLLDPMIEETIREAIHKTPTGSYLALEPALTRDILAAVTRTIPNTAREAVILTNAGIRRHVRRLVEEEHPQLAVLSFEELAPEVQLQPLGRVRV